MFLNNVELFLDAKEKVLNFKSGIFPIKDKLPTPEREPIPKPTPEPIHESTPEPAPKPAPNSKIFDTHKTKRRISPLKLREKF